MRTYGDYQERGIEMKEKYVDSSLLDKAIIFAVKAHKNIERRGKGLPYIVHPLEVVAIAASMTNDQEILAAAALHDVVEDTEITIEEISKEFGPRVANIVRSETDDKTLLNTPDQGWLARKALAIQVIASAPTECKIVALGDKLSNVRAMYYDYQRIGDELWNMFRDKDKNHHSWRFHSLVNALSELKVFPAYKEFKYLVDTLFPQD